MPDAENKSKKFVMLATYVVAVLCLLLGLFLPLFNGKEIIALQLPNILKTLFGKGTPSESHPFNLVYRINLFGIERLGFDFMALVLALYALITALAVLAFIPVALSVRKEGKLATKLYYAVEIVAVAVLSLYFIVVLHMYHIRSAMPPEMSFVPYAYLSSAGINMAVAVGGTVLALLVLCGMDKGKAATVKIVLCLLSVIGLLALTDIALVSGKISDSLGDKLSSALVNSNSGTDYLTVLFATKISDSLAVMPDTKNKALLVLGAVAATVVLINLFIDAVKLATGTNKKIGHIFDIARYGLEIAAIACFLITALICKTTIGVMLIAMLAAVAVQLAISVIRFVLFIRKKPEERDDDEDSDGETDAAFVSEENTQTTEDAADATEAETEEKLEFNEEYNGEEYNDDYSDIEYSDDGYTAPSADDYEEPEYEDVLQPDDQTDTVEETQSNATEEPVQTEEPPEMFYEPDHDSAYIMPPESSAAEEAINEPENIPQVEQPAPAEHYEEVAQQPYEQPVAQQSYEQPIIQQPYEEPVAEQLSFEEQPVAQEQYVEPYAEEQYVEPYAQEQYVEEPYEEEQYIEEPYEEEPYEEEPYEEEPYEEEQYVEEPDEEEPYEEDEKPYEPPVKPYNPYESHDNRYRPYESSGSAQPYNPYRQQEEKPAQSTYERAVQPARPAYERPVQSYKPSQPADRQQSGRPLQPRSIIQEFKPVPPIKEQAPKETQVYTIDTIYAGPVDDFIRKLSNDERIEFAKTFIEKNRGNLGNIPDYVVGGDNKKFFSVSFIYLGRIRGLVSDGLLNKMYKELNLL